MVGRRRSRDRLGAAVGPGARSQPGRLRPVVRRGAAEHQRQLPGPPRGRRAGRAGRADLGQPDGGAHRDVHLRAASGPHGAGGGRAGGARHRLRRPGGDLHAHGAGGGDRHAGLRAAGGGAFSGVRRVRRGGAGQADRGRAAPRRRVRLLRAGAGAGRRLQAAAGPRHLHQQPQARRLPDPATPDAGRRHAARPRLGLPGGRGRRRAAWPGAGAGDGPAVCPLPPLEPRGSPRASCATPGAMRWHCSTPCG